MDADRTSLGIRSWGIRSILTVLLCAAVSYAASRAQAPVKPQQIIEAMIVNEIAAAEHPQRYQYTSKERSNRTGGHLWTERVVETAPGRVRLLLAEDGKPVSAARMQRERAALQQIAAHPDEFARHEHNTRLEEKRARDMYSVLPKDFLFDDVRLDNGIWTMSFRPNPHYTPSGISERILHNMAGHLSIDAKALRLIHLDFHLTQEVAIGFGLLANVHPGTSFVSDRQLIDGRWHTVHAATVVKARAILFKTIDLNLDVVRSDFQPVDSKLTVPQAVAMLLRQNPG